MALLKIANSIPASSTILHSVTDRAQTVTTLVDLRLLTTPAGSRAVIPELLARSPHHTAADIDVYALYEQASYTSARRTTVADRLGITVKTVAGALARLGREHGTYDPDSPYAMQPQWMATRRVGPHSWSRWEVAGTSPVHVPASLYGSKGIAAPVSAGARRLYINARAEWRRQGSTGVVCVPMADLARWSRLRLYGKGGGGGYTMRDAMAELTATGYMVSYQRAGGMVLIVPLWSPADTATRDAVTQTLIAMTQTTATGQAKSRRNPAATPSPSGDVTPSPSGDVTPSPSGDTVYRPPGFRPERSRPAPGASDDEPDTADADAPSAAQQSAAEAHAARVWARARLAQAREAQADRVRGISRPWSRQDQTLARAQARARAERDTVAA